MDVGPIQYWKSGSSYKKHEIVQLGNLAYPDPSSAITLSNGKGDSIDLSSNTLKYVGETFNIEKSIEYVASCMIKKDEISASTIDENRTLIIKKTNAPGGSGDIDTRKSIGVGIGLEFYNNNGKLQPDDFRFTYRLFASSELDDKEWLNAQIHIRQQSVPSAATRARAPCSQLRQRGTRAPAILGGQIRDRGRRIHRRPTE